MGGQTPSALGRHVLFLNWRDTRNPEGGGSELYVERIAAELVSAGHRATVVCAAHSDGPPEEFTGAGVRIVRRGGHRSVYVRAALAYIGGWFGLGPLASGRGGRPDIVVDVCNGLPFLSPLYARKPVIALVHHVHREQWPVVLPGLQGRLGWWIESRLAPRLYGRCRYVTVSEATRAELVELGVDRARISVIHNGTPEAPTTPVARSSTPSLAVLSRLVPHKQVEVALHAVAALAGEIPELQLVVAGQGWWEPRLREMVRDLGITNRVQFAGFVTEDEKHALLGSAWLALNPSLKEGWGLTIVEAGARGTPTVAFRSAGGVAESLLDGQTGLLADDYGAFVDHVRTLLTDEPRRRAMADAARVHAARFTWRTAGERFAAIVGAKTAIVPRPRPERHLVP